MNDSTSTSEANNTQSDQSHVTYENTSNNSISQPQEKHKSNGVQQRIKNFVFTKKDQQIWGVALMVFAVFILAAGAYGYGYNNGHKKGKVVGKQQAVAATNPLSKLINPFNTQTGEIANIDGDKLTLNTSQGQVQEIKLTDKTIITRKTDKLKRSDLKKDQKVTIMLRSSGGNEATRIIVRS